MAADLSKSTSRLGWRMMHHICEDEVPPNGASVSPLSLTIALGMLAIGASPHIKEQLCAKLGISNMADLTVVFPHLIKQFGPDSNAEILSIANAVFTDQTFTMNPNYAKAMELFAAYVKSDFSSLEAGVDNINCWISDNTNGLIQNMLKPINLRNAHVALVNALAFKGSWQEEFDPQHTRKNYAFKVGGSQTRPVDMMFLDHPRLPVHFEESYTAVRLPYASSPSSSQLSMIAYLPDETRSLSELLLNLQEQDIPQFSETKLSRLGFPKFKMKTALEVFSVLKSFEYPLDHDFPEMGNGPNVVTSVLHNTVIDVDEHGTKAAAATVVVLSRSRPIRQPPSIIFERPFAFSIVVDATNLVVFSGVFTADKQ